MGKKLPALVLAACLLTGALSGCGRSGAAGDLTAPYALKSTPETAAVSGADAAAAAEFGTALFRACRPAEQNTLISPLSVLTALSLTANGARGETLSQMEAVLGLPVSGLNAFLAAWRAALPADDKAALRSANALWLRDDGSLVPSDDFLRTAAQVYGASVYKAAFDDGTRQAINTWVSDQTGGLIPSILDRIDPQALLYLLNALSFEGEWETVYDKTQVRQNTFTAETGVQRTVDMMYGTEYAYLEDGLATGFIQYYAGRDYAFAALLPNAGVSLADYTAQLTGEGLLRTLESAQAVETYTGLPRFSCGYSAELGDILGAMGMPDAFDAEKADFTGLGACDNNLFISRVLHRTFIAVDELGTRAGAVTAVEVAAGSALVTDYREVYLDRPFVYMILDCGTNLPLFLGTVTDIP